MDIFVNSDSDDDPDLYMENGLQLLCDNQCFVELMSLRPIYKTSTTILSKSSHLFDNLHILVLNDGVCSRYLSEKLCASHFQNVRVLQRHELTSSDVFDIILCPFSDHVTSPISHDHSAHFSSISSFGHQHLIAGGCLLSTMSSTDLLYFPTNMWMTESASMKTISGLLISALSHCDIKTVSIRTRMIKCNTNIETMWTREGQHGSLLSGPSGNESVAFAFDTLKKENTYPAIQAPCPSELEQLEAATVTCSLAERNLRVLNSSAHAKAVAALHEHGICIVKNLFSMESIAAWAECVHADFTDAQAPLLSRGIDLNRPGEGSFINNFYELSMREARRCDFRNGLRMDQLARRIDCARTNHSNQSEAINQATIAKDLKGHPVLVSLLTDAMNLPRDSLAAGDWGRWNFDGGGPDAPPPAPVGGAVGAIMTLPGCKNQTIHADTPHLYTHTHLPPHYINVFMPAVAEAHRDDFSVGQTAFVLGSHQLSASHLMMVKSGGDAEIAKRLVRPHLHPGDALLFDCRILHFGLANQSHDICRAILYVNYHQPWFVDPKNWNNEEKLFTEDQRRRS